MKKVLILVVSSHEQPYEKMIGTSMKTWDAIEVENVETMFYCGKPHNSRYNPKIISFPINESYATMGYKALMAFEWALMHKNFDYVARVNSSCYVDKKQLHEYIQELPYNNVFSCIEVEGPKKWAWGGGQFLMSTDVMQKIVDHKSQWNHTVMEDVAISNLVDELGIPYMPGKCCSLNEKDGAWLCLGYGAESIEFSDFNDLKPLKHHFYRVKIDRDRNIDEFLMNQLYNTLK